MVKTSIEKFFGNKYVQLAALAAGAISVWRAFHQPQGAYGIGWARHRSFGGNSGYDGYSMSVRAREARADGKYPKTDFKKVYGLTDLAFSLLLVCDIIVEREWHHTSSWGNKTPFYDWDGDWFADTYINNKSEIDRLAREHKNTIDPLERKRIWEKIWDIFGV